jgi:hypothetical protein
MQASLGRMEERSRVGSTTPRCLAPAPAIIGSVELQDTAKWSLGRMMMKKFLSALVVAVLSHLVNDAIVAAPAYAESLDKNVLAMHARLDELCRGGSRDDPATQVSCDARLNFEQTLAQRGYCYGIGDRAHAAWHKCQR